MCQNSGQNRDDAVDRAAQIDTHHPIPIGEGGNIGRPHHSHAGIVAEQMDGPEFCLDRIGGGGEGGAVGHVQPDRQHPPAAAQFSHRLIEMILANVGNGHVHARAQQCLGDAKADTAGAAGHERGLPGRSCMSSLLSERNFCPKAISSLCSPSRDCMQG
jgi:hypothetical protein